MSGDAEISGFCGSVVRVGQDLSLKQILQSNRKNCRCRALTPARSAVLKVVKNF